MKRSAIIALTALFAAGSAAAHEPGEHRAHEHSPADEPKLGQQADPAQAQRTITIEMADSYRFSPSRITVRQGEIVRFVAVNAGTDTHEMVLGTMDELKAHAAMMKQHPDMAHDEPGMVRVAPANSGVIAWQFTQPGELYFGCLVDDHFERGMVGTIRVVAAEADEPPMDHSHMEHGAGGMQEHGEHAAHEMQGMFGAYSMTRESSGTSWQPEASPQQGIHGTFAGWSTMTHGMANLIYDDQGGPRGETKSFSTSMLMVMAQHPAGPGTFGLRAMVSADPWMGKRGYPLLLQTGESANGEPLIDRQHPHDLFMELAASYRHPLSEQSSLFVYAGLPGEPALGPPAFMHRFSGEDNPEAPISHHWLDSTHVTFGVVTLGYIYGNVKLEGSVFRGREPDENRYDIETGSLDSASVRLSYNPTRHWALQASRGHLKSPEALHPEDDLDRTTASAIYHHDFGRASLQTTLAWGRNSPSHGDSTDVLLLESALRLSRSHTFFARAERAEKNELFLPDDPRADERFTVGKLSVGYIYDLPRESRFRVGVGGLVSRYRLPDELDSVYGNPTSFMLFARIKVM